tara:strand:- start:4358 stop:5065 length:708 start_codon:yes stop_codon:yes gene_type:complete
MAFAGYTEVPAQTTKVCPPAAPRHGHAQPIELEITVTPNCSCNRPSVERTVKKESANKGRQFYVCSTRDGCNFFEWKDAPKTNAPNSESGSKRKRYNTKPNIYEREKINEPGTVSTIRADNVVLFHPSYKSLSRPDQAVYAYCLSIFDGSVSILSPVESESRDCACVAITLCDNDVVNHPGLLSSFKAGDTFLAKYGAIAGKAEWGNKSVVVAAVQPTLFPKWVIRFGDVTGIEI